MYVTRTCTRCGEPAPMRSNQQWCPPCGRLRARERDRLRHWHEDPLTIPDEGRTSMDGSQVRLQCQESGEDCYGELAGNGSVVLEWGTGRRVPVRPGASLTVARGVDYRATAAKQRGAA